MKVDKTNVTAKKLFSLLRKNIKSGGFVNVNHIFTEYGLDTFEIRETIRQYINGGLIEFTDDYILLGQAGQRKVYTIDDIIIKARLTAKGELYVKQVFSRHHTRSYAS